MSRTNCAIGRDYVRASFKGVPFDCKEVDVEGGRRGAEGEFPFGEQTAYADLGRKIRVYHLTAVFREDSHVGDSQALFNVCESPGPGMLVHPTRGAAMAACRSVKVKDNQEEPGETDVELEFVEANSGAGAGGGFGGSLFGIISSGLNAASSGSFRSGYRPSSVVQPWRTDVIHTAQTMVQSVAEATEQSTPIDAPLQDWRNILRMKEIAQDDGLAADAAKVDQALTYGFNATAFNLNDPNDKFSKMTKLANTAASTTKLPVGTAADSEEAVLSRQRVLAAIGMAQAAMARKYATIDQALAAMDQTTMVLEDEATTAYNNCDNGLFMELRNYETQFREMMNNLAYRLPPVIAVDFMGGVHPLVAAYALYKDARKHRELEQRNMVDANGRFRPAIAAVGS